MFFNIASFPVLTITLRNNMMKLFVPNLVPEKPWQITKYTLLFTFVILGPVFVGALFLRNDI